VFIGGRAKPSVTLEPDGFVLGRGLRDLEDTADADDKAARNHQGTHEHLKKAVEGGNASMGRRFPLTPAGTAGKIVVVSHRLYRL
jgi:hypothetical protein